MSNQSNLPARFSPPGYNHSQKILLPASIDERAGAI
jgi:hypothetical protein